MTGPSITRTMVINDLHIPFHDSRLVTISAGGMLLDIAADIGVDRLILNGDVLDCYNWNRYGIHPEVEVDMDTELYLGRCFFENLRERFPHTKIVFLFGNHEDRYERWVIEKARPMYNRLRLENELGLDRLDIEWYPYQTPYQVDGSNTWLIHSPPSYGVNGARTSLLTKMDQSWIYACTHREQKACISAGSGQVYTAYFNGWLGSIDETPSHRKVYSYRKGHFNWQHCAALLTTVDDVRTHVNQISIRDHACIVDGVYYDYSEEEVQDELRYSKED